MSKEAGQGGGGGGDTCFGDKQFFFSQKIVWKNNHGTEVFTEVILSYPGHKVAFVNSTI